MLATVIHEGNGGMIPPCELCFVPGDATRSHHGVSLIRSHSYGCDMDGTASNVSFFFVFCGDDELQNCTPPAAAATVPSPHRHVCSD